MLISHINDQAFDYLEIRSKEIATLKTEIDWKKRREKIKVSLMKCIGSFPEKTPLNPKITGILKKNGYRVEKIIYESISKFYVTASLFIPDGIKGKRPVVIHVSGHSDLGFREPTYQILIHNLVKNRIYCFCYRSYRAEGERSAL